MCCLRYEHDFYVESRRRFPKEGRIVATAAGEEKVVSVDLFRETVTLRIVAQHADIWNGFGPVENFARKNRILNDWCEKVGRDPSSIERSVLLNEPADLDHVGEFIRSGAQHLIVPVGTPFDLADVEAVLRLAQAAQ